VGAIVTGGFANLGDVYSLTLKAINIETATVAVSYPADIAKSARIETLLASGGGAAASRPSVQIAQAQTPGPAVTPQPALAPVVTLAPVAPAPATFGVEQVKLERDYRGIHVYLYLTDRFTYNGQEPVREKNSIVGKRLIASHGFTVDKGGIDEVYLTSDDEGGWIRLKVYGNDNPAKVSYNGRLNIVKLNDTTKLEAFTDRIIPQR
jgi:hypothetical protein